MGSDSDPGFAGIKPKAADQFVGKRRFAGAAGAGDAQNRGRDAFPSQVVKGGETVFRKLVQFQRRYEPRQITKRPRSQPFQVNERRRFGRRGGAFHHVGDHPVEAHFPAVFGGIDAGDAVILKFLDLSGDDDPATAAENLDVRPPTLG